MDLHTHNLNFIRGNKKILNNISLSIKSNKITAIVGENGTGKSSLLKALSGLLPEALEHVSLGESKLKKIKNNQRSKIIAWCPAESTLSFPYCVLDVCLMGLYPWHQGFIKEEHRNQAIKTLKLFGINNLAEKNYQILSSGQKKMVDIARSFTGFHKIILLDEPTAFLDMKNSFQLFEIFQKKKEQETTLVLATHDIEKAYRLCDNIIFMKSGEVLAHLNSSHKNIPQTIAKTFDISVSLVNDKNFGENSLCFFPKKTFQDMACNREIKKL